MWPKVVGSHKIDVMYPLCNQLTQSGEKLFQTVELPDMLLGELEVLTKEAPAGAARKKDRSRTMLPHQAGLLAEMGQHRGDAQLCSFPAEACLAIHTVDTALAWA
jgi:hypothetical protein